MKEGSSRMDSKAIFLDRFVTVIALTIYLKSPSFLRYMRMSHPGLLTRAGIIAGFFVTSSRTLKRLQVIYCFTGGV